MCSTTRSCPRTPKASRRTATSLERASFDALERASGVARAEMRAFAERYARAERVIACWAMGLTQHVHGVANVREVVNLLLLRGNIGRPGAGPCPVRGHSNVQGDRTMGIWERPTPEFLDRLAGEFGFEPPRSHGHDTVSALHALDQGRAHVFIALGGNFARATPDSAFGARALGRAALTVQISTTLNRSHLVHGREALILPTLGRTERDLRGDTPQFVTVEDSMRCVHRSQGRLEPASAELRSEPAIVCGIARAALGPAHPFPWEEFASDYDRVRERIARVIPGFEDMNRRVREEGGFVLPSAAGTRAFRTGSGRAHFTVQAFPAHELPPEQLWLMTIRSHDQYNTTIYVRRRSLPRRERRSPRGVPEPRGHGRTPARVRSAGRAHQSLPRRDAHARGFSRARLRPAARLRGSVLSRGESARADRRFRRREPHARLQVAADLAARRRGSPRMTCAGCGESNRAGARFCNGCGAKLETPARAPTREPRSYTPPHLAERILRSRSALEGERKQVTVLFADVRESMVLAEALGMETWHATLDRFFAALALVVHRYEGTINQYTGDGVMALFGAPLALEDHAERACACALELREPLRRLAHDLRREHGVDFAVRMGLHSGEVVVGRIGDDLRMDYTAQGPVVGTAQRIEQLAEAGRPYPVRGHRAPGRGLLRARGPGRGPAARRAARRCGSSRSTARARSRAASSARGGAASRASSGANASSPRSRRPSRARRRHAPRRGDRRGGLRQDPRCVTSSACRRARAARA